jgi:hypothetical protein
MKKLAIVAVSLVALMATSAVGQDTGPSNYIVEAKPTITWATNSAITIMSNEQDRIVRDGAGRDLADLPVAEQIAKLCAALEAVSRVKFAKCGSASKPKEEKEK